jgi:natural product biosynthesis luciferase-like monooxygenase protein/amino acid adenylation domain-containing protein
LLDDPSPAWDGYPETNPDPAAVPLTPDHLAYVIYTSGSTGAPKGVMVQHRALQNFFFAMDRILKEDTSPSQWVSTTSISFDISVLELFWPLARGHQILLHPGLTALTSRRKRRTQPRQFSLFFFAAADETRQQEKYRLLLESARIADERGFCAIWTPERHFHSFGGLYPNPSITGAAIAAITKRIEIRAGSVVLPLHDPLRVAEEWAVVDNLSNGRVAISFASGWNANDFVLRPEQFHQRRQIMMQDIETVRSLWRGEAVTRRNGAGREVSVHIYPRPVQNELKIWLTAAANPDTFRAAGEMGADLLTHLLGQDIQELSEKIAIYRSAYRKGHRGNGHVALMLHTFVGSDAGSAHDIVHDPFCKYLEQSVDLLRGLSHSLDLDIDSERFTQDDLKTLAQHAFDRYYGTSALIGDEDTCLRMLERLGDADVDEIACLVDFGVELETTLEGLSRLADLKDRWLGGIATKNIATDWHDRYIQCTPSFASALLEHWNYEQAQPLLKRILVGGEACSSVLYSKLCERATDGVLNMYGPTETTIWSSVYSSQGEKESGIVPIGRPIANTRIYILDVQRKPAPVGIAGEIYIGGAGVARGYLNRPELTAERFLKDPFVSEPGARMYKTGDLGRWLPDGNIEFLGRNDFQIKIRGFRIELGEIETRLAEHPSIREAVVLAREDQPGDKRLVAYYVARAEDQDELHADVLRAHLSASLPEHMVPAAYVSLHSLPLTPNGKLDRKALPAPDTDAYAVQNYEEPQGETEILLARIWAEVLKLDRIGRRDNFFELGGQSLLAVQLMGRIQQALYREVRLADIFAQPTLDKLAKILPGAEQARLPAITPAERRDNLPLSFAQQRLWFLAQLEGGSEAYHIPFGLELDGELDRSALRQALDRILVRHEALRTTFTTLDGVPLQRITPAAISRFLLLEQDLRPHPDLQSEVERLSAEEVNQPFDLEQGPLIRGRLLRLGEVRHVLLITMHHIISDGWSMGIWVDEFSALYRAFREQRPDPLPPIPLQYADYAVWQRQWLEGEVLQQQAEFWKNNLAGAPPLLELPADHPRPAQLSYAGSYVAFEIDSQLTEALRDLSRRHNTTLYMTLLAGWATLLSRLSGQQDLVIGTPTANRGRSEIEGLIGFFVNTLALRLDLSHAPKVSDLLARVKAQTLAAQQHQDIPFEQVVELARPIRSLAHSPLFQAALAWQNAPDSAPVLPGLAVQRVETSSYQMAELDLTLSLHEAGETLAGAIKYATALFNRSTIERYLAYFRNLLRAMADDPTMSIDRLPMLPADERQQVLYGWNEMVMDYPRERCVHQLFEEQVARTPEATALIFEDRQLSYAELNRQANRLAHYLRELGVKPDDRVALCLERGFEMMVGLLAVLKAGGAYVPLDPAYPAERLRFMLDDSAPVALLTQTHLRSLMPDGFGFRVLLLENQSPAWNGYSDINPDPAAVALTSDHLAYVMYTSGSTGKPKGVMVGHRSVVNFLGSMSVEPGMTHLDSILAVTSLSFDIAGLELLLPLVNGAVSVLAGRTDAADPACLQQALSRYRVTMMQATPATWRMLLDSGWSGSLDFKVLCGGEALPADLSARLRKRVGTLWNMYGPTETTIWSTCRQVDAISVPTSAYESIGHPIANTQVYLLDANLQPVPPGVFGNLYIGGDGVARGYLNRPELTAERFVRDPFSGKPGARIYKTGDLGRWLPDGNIEFLGRDDDQVKIRGFRIELGEIEARLEEHPGIREAVALAREDQSGDKRLVAYYVPVTAGQDELSVDALRAHLSKALPEYMVPAAYMRLEALPLTPNGKLDRKALPAPDGDAFAVRGYEPPEGNTETTLAAIWAELLKLDRVGRHDNFFELGGHSLLAVTLIERMRRNGVRADVRALFATPTLAELAAAVAGAEPQVQVPPNLIPALKREKSLSPDEVELSI